ncbi:glycosyltransferase family 4 protein [Anaerobium acetethylicum]|uniref:Glycosyl transferases group 1 n=1 Tax=Anaerobium acetethylicum TaxID=1619234 RepID=A0A1D3TQD0_9FIRM|nr:glycosyltransferase family 4 protein [Anaerobium acetethylicum]SCP95753.1 Glycosyl transferases group 1 [Anaerobium acetethylicum]
MKPIAFVIPWYGDDIQGGAEIECNHLAHCFMDSGMEVEVLTTCVKKAADDKGKNTLHAGISKESGVLVRRFKVRKQNKDRYNCANLKLYNNMPVTAEEERMYVEEDINSPAMYRYIRDNRDKYECFIFMPYLYGPTYNGSRECPDNCIMIPCFHDESYAYMNLTKECAARFKGMIFLSKPEGELAHRLYDLSKVKTAVLGAYVESGWEDSCDPQAFREKYNIQDDFILYAGRKDSGKKADELMKFFIQYKKFHKEEKLKLVIIGGGTLEIPREFQREVIDLGFVSIEDKHNAFAASLFLCNPSYFESFSIVIMESWLAKRPVLVSEHCAVTTNFCQENNGGLYYDNFGTFCGCLDFMIKNKEIADKMGENGFKYVTENFTHKVISEKYIRFLRGIIEDKSTAFTK